MILLLLISREFINCREHIFFLQGKHILKKHEDIFLHVICERQNSSFSFILIRKQFSWVNDASSHAILQEQNQEYSFPADKNIHGK